MQRSALSTTERLFLLLLRQRACPSSECSLLLTLENRTYYVVCLSLSLALPRCIYTLSSRITYGNHGFAMMCELQLVTDCHAAVQMVQVPTGFSVSMYDFSRRRCRACSQWTSGLWWILRAPCGHCLRRQSGELDRTIGFSTSSPRPSRVDASGTASAGQDNK